MKYIVSLVLVLALMGMTPPAEKKLKPYIHGANSSLDMSQTKAKVSASLKAQGFAIIGQYKPANDAGRYIYIISSPELTNAAKTVGGLSSIAATMRVGLTKEGSQIQVSYTNPYYWGNAYYQDNYSKVESSLASAFKKLNLAMKGSGTYVGKYFGSKEGVALSDLREYQYMMGMPEFDDVVELAEFDSHAAAVAKVEANIKKGIPNVKKVYSKKIPGKNVVIYGFAVSGPTGESKFLPTIDILKPKHTAFLPYEIIVKGKEVVMLHGRFRIALAFPDLTMGTFTKIMSTPGDIEDLLEKTCN